MRQCSAVWINPRGIAGDLIEADFYELAPLLDLVLKNNEKQKTKLEDDVVELGVIAQGLAKAAGIALEAIHSCYDQRPLFGHPEAG